MHPAALECCKSPASTVMDLWELCRSFGYTESLKHQPVFPFKLLNAALNGLFFNLILWEYAFRDVILSVWFGV